MPDEKPIDLDEVDAALHERFPYVAAYDANNESPIVCQECDGAIDDHKPNCIVPLVHRLSRELREALEREAYQAETLCLVNAEREKAERESDRHFARVEQLEAELEQAVKHIRRLTAITGASND